jgi:hypothetical protein
MSKSKRPQQKGAKYVVYDGCVRALSMAYELLPRAEMRERFRVCRMAYKAHVRDGLPWKRWPDHARDFVRARFQAEAAALKEERDKAREADKLERRQRASKGLDDGPRPFAELAGAALHRHASGA